MTRALILAMPIAASAATLPPCIPPEMVPMLPASVVSASTAGKPMQLAPFRHTSANGEAIYWSCRMPDQSIQYAAYYATATAWADAHEQANAQYRMAAMWDQFWSRLAGPSCWAPEAISSTDPQLKVLCAEIRAKAAAIQ